MRRKGQYLEAGCLTSVAAATTWPMQRKLELGLVTDATCPRCKAAVETQEHRVWDCTCNVDDPIFDSTKGLCRKARLKGRIWPGFWQRGILPREWMPEVPRLEDRGYWTFGDWDPRQAPAFDPAGQDTWTVLFGDASGGPYTMTPPLRRVAGAVIQLRGLEDLRLHRGVGCVLASDEPQQVCYGELAMFLEALKLCQGPLLYVTDDDKVAHG